MATYKVQMTVTGRTIHGVRKELAKANPGASIQVEKEERNPSRADRFSKAEDHVGEAKSVCEELRDELQNWLDNLPENLQAGTKADELQEAIDALENITGDLENIDFSSVTFPAMR